MEANYTTLSEPQGQENKSTKNQTRKGILRFVPFILFVSSIIFLIYFFNEGYISLLPQSKKTGVVEMAFLDKEYRENFSKKYSVDKVLDISSFENNEGWTGNNIGYDDSNYYDGNMSMNLAIKENEINTISLTKSINLNSYDTYKFIVLLPKSETKKSLKIFHFRFSNKYNSFIYTIPFNKLRVGWNVISMSKNKFTKENNKLDIDWGNIEKLVLIFKQIEIRVFFLIDYGLKLMQIIKMTSNLLIMKIFHLKNMVIIFI